MAPRKVLVYWVDVFFLITLFLRRGSAENVNFYFPSLNFRNLTFLGDSHIRNGVVGLTRELTVPSSRAGAVIYTNPNRFFDPESNITVSFSTKFAFSIANVNPSSYGDGISFFLSQDNLTLGSPGGYLGLVNSSQLTKNKFVAVEFDTKLDLHFDDPNDNHVGLDIESLNSIKTADPISQGVDLKGGNSITAWIDYKNDQEKLRVYLSYSNFKPEKPVLSVDIDLSEHLKEVMFVGFSASTEGSTEIHLVENRSFHTFGFVAKMPRLQPHNVSDTYVAVSPRIPVSGSGDKHHRRLGLGLGIAGPAFFCVALVVFSYVSVMKWMEVRKQKSFKAEVVAGPREFSYKELKSATGGFHPSRILGHGAFGTVYKAFFVSSGTISAVKRSKHSHEGKTEFLSELSIIACLRHKNLVHLQGWCVEKGELLLVYDFMPNGSLEKAPYQESVRRNLLDWSRRLNIAVRLASVLAYLHQECEQQVIHRDIKTGNVSLDGNLNARLSDFGIGSGTVTSAMLLELGLVLGSDSRITAGEGRIVADALKLQTIRVHPPTFGVWCGGSEAANGFLQALKSKAKLGKSIEFLVQRGEAFLNRHHDREAFAVYVCYMEDQVPAGYIFYYNPKVARHKKNCKGVDDCKCPIDHIKRGSRKLVYGGAFTDGSGGEHAHDDLSRIFNDAKKEEQDDAEDYKLVKIKRKLGIDLGKARFLTRFAMFQASLKEPYCGAPFRVCSVTTDGIVEREGPFGFIRTCLDFFNMLKAREKTLFLIYHKRLEGSNFGRFVVENIPIGYEKVKRSGHRVALLQGDFCLHHLTLKEAEDVDTLFNSAKVVIKRPHFSTNEFHLKSHTLNMTTLKRNKRKREESFEGFKSAKFSYHEVAKFKDYEVIYMGRPTKDFLKSLKETITIFEGESPDDNQV